MRQTVRCAETQRRHWEWRFGFLGLMSILSRFRDVKEHARRGGATDPRGLLRTLEIGGGFVQYVSSGAFEDGLGAWVCSVLVAQS